MSENKSEYDVKVMEKVENLFADGFKNFVKKLILGSACAGLVFGLASCGNYPTQDMEYSTKDGVEKTQEFTLNDNYSVEFVHTEHGDYKCLWYLRNSEYRTMSCDEVDTTEGVNSPKE